ncbi:hypothetical protein HAX54_018035 [Datura stramonium]|uniref:non-specific serine/threonine protein kinase n=1 Tax=Datura stramonium TaxID=4076 RepID=A0ABS8Y5U4_DATST|nr:hypothetical protein [Datura stramonium]
MPSDSSFLLDAENLEIALSNWSAVHINCGGGSVKIGDTTYEADENSAGAAKFIYSKESWGASNTGYFWGRRMSIDNYKATNISSINGNDSYLYMTAQLSALSLTHYGRLANVNYIVTLHFADIVIRDNRSFQALGKQMFDDYIQGDRKLKDFNIRNEAGGVDKALKRKFNAVVEDGILEVRFQQIKDAINNFDASNKIGEGGFGSVYKGTLSDGTVIAVKQLSSKSKQGNREFVNEIGMISGLQHPNLVRLYGCCAEGNQLLLVYEYLENNSLARALFDVYSFGVVALEIVAGKNNMTYRPNEKFVCLLDWALDLQRKGKLMELVDERLGSDLNKDEALRMINVALLCIDPSPAVRPTMSEVVRILEHHIDLPEFNNLESRRYCDDDDVFKFQGLRDKYNDMFQTQTLADSSSNTTGRNFSSTTSTSA